MSNIYIDTSTNKEKDDDKLHSLCFGYGICDMCGSKNQDVDENIEVTLFHSHTGWRICGNPKCSEQVKKYVLNKIDELEYVPIQGLIPHGDHVLNLKFYRKSQDNVVRCHIKLFNCDNRKALLRKTKDKSELLLRVFFNDNDNFRDTTLSNLFFHNPDLYEKIKNCEDLLGNSYVKISYAELPDKIKSYIEESYHIASKSVVGKFEF